MKREELNKLKCLLDTFKEEYFKGNKEIDNIMADITELLE